MPRMLFGEELVERDRNKCTEFAIPLDEFRGAIVEPNRKAESTHVPLRGDDSRKG